MPCKTRSINSHVAPPAFTTTGVSRVKIAVLRRPIPNVHLPPYLSAKYPPGICVIAYP